MEHDEEVLALEGVSIDGTAAEPAMDGGFFVADMSDIERCPHRDRHCGGALPGGGYITAVILSFRREMELPLGRNAVCRASYSTRKDPGPPGTLIRIVHQKLRKRERPRRHLGAAVRFFARPRAAGPVPAVRIRLDPGADTDPLRGIELRGVRWITSNLQLEKASHGISSSVGSRPHSKAPR